MEKRVTLISIFLVAALNAQVNIAVIDFEGKNVSKADASALTDRLRAELFLTGKFVVLEREKMGKILEEQGFQLSGCTDDACIVQMGQLIGVEQIVAGSISHVGNVYSVIARIISIETGQIVKIAKFDNEGLVGDLMMYGMNNVALQLAGLTAVQTINKKPQITEQPKSETTLPKSVYQPPTSVMSRL
ncbi:MAG: CsgG/HfaB family protein [Candidatus Gracilibacteria bacterium]